MRISCPVRKGRSRAFAGVFRTSTRLSTGVDSSRIDTRLVVLSTAFPLAGPCGQREVRTVGESVRLYSPAVGLKHGSVRPRSFFRRHETDLSAERTQAEAEARLPQPDVDACRPPHPQAPSRQGAQAPLGVSRCSAGTASLAPATSTPSTATAGRFRPGS
jgi:hypothetical protein